MKKSMKCSGLAALAVIALFMAASLSFAATETIDFSQLIPLCIPSNIESCQGQPADNLNNGLGLSCADTTCTDSNTGLMATGYSFVSGAFTPTSLWVRNVFYGDATDKGLGVCDPTEASGQVPGYPPGTTCFQTGDLNELSNEAAPELIVLTLPPGFVWKQVQISSMDPIMG